MKRLCVGCLVVTEVTGVILLILTISFTPLLSYIEHVKMRQMLPVAPGSYSHDFWATPPVPVYFGLHVFHIVNPDEVMQGQPPVLKDTGPYTYRVSLEKYNITFNANNTVTYRQRQTFVFDRERSVGSDNDTFITANVPLFTVGTLMQHEISPLKEALNLLLEVLGEKALINVSVHDIFWGYKDPFMTLAKDTLDIFHVKNKFITGDFGFYMGRNGTDDGLYTVHTGTDDLDKFLVIDRWNGEKLLNYWSTMEANMINGTDGSLYPPFVTTDRVLQMYDSNLMKSMSMVYKEPSNVQGITTMKFLVENNQFANETVYPPNAGFCTPLHHCMPSGLLNSSAMGFGAPLYASLPHFLGADPYYFKLVDGLHPESKLHQPYFDLHQLTGVCLKAARRYQLNVQIREFDFLTKTRGVKLAYVPVLWIDGVAEIDDRIADMFKDQIEDVMAILGGFHIAFYCLVPILILIPIVVALNLRRKRRRLLLKQASENGTAHGYVNGITTVHANGTTNGTTSHANGTAVHANGTTPHANGTAVHANGSTPHANGTAVHANGSTPHANGSAVHANGTVPAKNTAGGRVSVDLDETTPLLVNS